MAAMFDFFLIRTSYSLRSSLVVSTDLENWGTAVGIPLPSCIEAEICVISYLLPVNGSHLWFHTDPNIGYSYEYSNRVARPRKHGHSFWNFVAITYTTKDTSVMYFRFMDAILIFGMDFCHRLFLLSSATLHAVLKNLIPITVSLIIGLLHYSWYDDAFFIHEFIYNCFYRHLL